MATYHTVKQGECLSLIAWHYGFPKWETIYEHAKNADFRKRRPDPDLIYPGDILYIPDKEERSEGGSTDQTHKFVVRGGKRLIRITIRDADHEPVAGAAYELTCGGVKIEGVTDAEGTLEEEIPVQAKTGELAVAGHTFNLGIAHLNPVDDAPDKGATGIQQRLKNLGYDPGPIDGIIGPLTRAAVRAFQADYPPLEVDGICGPKTSKKLKEVYGC